MRPIDDSISLTPDERLAEVAGILAAGILRLHTRMALSPDATGLSARKNPAKSATPGLEVPDETVLSVHNGYPLQHTLHTIGLLPCCKTAACWKSRIVPTSDKDSSLCEQPVFGWQRPVAKCMASIPPSAVLQVLERCVPTTN